MLNRLKDAFECLNSESVKYVVIGGTAAILYGVPRATFDLDILIEATEENAKKLLEALRDAGFATATMIDAEELLRHEITIFRDRYRIDVQTRTPGICFADAWKNKVTVRLADTEVHLLSKGDLIAAKLASGRPVDLEDVRILRARDFTPG